MNAIPFIKYHALGNDYLVLSPIELDKTRIHRICHRNYSVGADGVLLGPLESETCDFRLRIFNPDGSEVEKKRELAGFLCQDARACDPGLQREHRS